MPMPAYTKTIKIPGRSAQDLYEKISADLDRMVEKWGVSQKMELSRDAAARKLHVKSSMVTAILTCSEGCLILDAKLSLLALPFRSKIDEQIERWVSKNFPA
ncbi:MAG: polyhydroxyalkanoic acid system family protein [Bdellovibrionales bacterium]|nr:polyhydroxyalkanoic acid system family protein [Bdellovibrionales bacterium]